MTNIIDLTLNELVIKLNLKKFHQQRLHLLMLKDQNHQKN